jgi:hypothetical protein
MVIVDFSANAADVHVDNISGRIEIQIPDVLQQHGARYNLFRVAYKIFEDPEFSRQERDLFSGTMGRACDQIEFEIKVSFATVVLRRASASMRASNSANANGFTR